MNKPNNQTKATAKNSKNKTSVLLRRLTVTAVFVAMGAAVKSVTKISLSAFGAGGMQISFGGIFTFFPAALFGPWYGGIASALSDIIGVIVAPTGAYIPWLTIAAFFGGFIKGLLWKMLTTKSLHRIRLPLAIVFVVLGVLGSAFGISLTSDGVLPSGTVVSAKEQLPQRYEINQMIEDDTLSPLSKFAVSLAQYNKNIYTLTSVSPDAVTADGELYLPSTIYDTATGETITPTKVSSSLFDGMDTLTTIVTRDQYQSFQAPDGVEIVKAELLPEGSGSTDEGYNYSSSDTYRKYLSGYINFAYAGLLFISLFGLLFLGVTLLMERLDRSGSRATQFMRIAISLIVSGTLVTTVNTFTLQIYTPAWAGRAFLILWIPRLLEEWIVCLIQSYVISLLYGMLTQGRLRSLFAKITDKL